MSPPRLLLVGGGKMGQALLAGWRARGAGEAVVVDPYLRPEDWPHPEPLRAAPPSGFRAEAVVLAIKPQQAAAVLPLYAGGEGVFLSIMAGWTLASLEAALGPKVVRAMPNTPAAIGQGMTVACAAAGVSVEERRLCDGLLRATGRVEWTEEGHMDAVTAVSGCGPAYAFYLAELMEAAGVARGLPRELARSLARETVAGAGALLRASGEDSEALRRAVTSPGGATEAALRVLGGPEAWPRSVPAAIEAAAARSREMGRG